MTVESARATPPSVKTHQFREGGTCANCGQFWPCQPILALARAIARRTPTPTEESRLFEELKRAHFAAHPDHKVRQQPEACRACASIVSFQNAVVLQPGPSEEFVVCSECGQELPNADLLAEHQVTVHEMTKQTEADRLETANVVLEDALEA